MGLDNQIDWPLTVAMSVVMIAIIAIAIAPLFLSNLDVNYFLMIIFVLTLIAILLYVEYTKRISEATLISASPTVSVTIQSGKFFHREDIEKLLMGLRVLSSTERENSEKSREIKKEIEKLTYETRIYVKNHSRLPMKAEINLNLKANGKSVPMGKNYCGREPWILNPYECINGRFNIDDCLNQKAIGTSIERMQLETTEENKEKQLTMTIKVQNVGVYRRLIEYPIRTWYFDFQKDEWHNKDFGIDA